MGRDLALGGEIQFLLGRKSGEEEMKLI